MVLTWEQMGHDRSAPAVALEFAPSITTSSGVREAVRTAFTDAGVATVDFQRPAYQLDAEHKHPDWQWASPTLQVHLSDGVSADLIGLDAALASVRARVPDLPFGIAIDDGDRQTLLAFRHDDDPAQIRQALRHFRKDLVAGSVWGWDRVTSSWIPL